MGVNLTVVETGEDFQFDPKAPDPDQTIAERVYMRTTPDVRPGRFRVECRDHDNALRFAHRRDPITGRVPGIYVKLVNYGSGKTWFVAHYDGTATHTIHNGESEGHRRAQDEYCKAADDAGYPNEHNKKIPSGAIPDVLIFGPASDVAVEVQRSRQTLRYTRARTTRISNGGFQPIWSWHELTVWNEHNSVPNVRTNNLIDALSSGRPPKDGWLAVGGLGSVQAEHCHPRNGTKCIVKGLGRFCGGWHPRREVPHLRVYEVVERAPAGDLVTLHWPNGGIDLVSPGDRDLYVELTGGLYVPKYSTPPPKAPQERTRHSDWQPSVNFEQILDERARAEPPAFRRMLFLCQGCGEAKALADNLCMYCRYRFGMAGS